MTSFCSKVSCRYRCFGMRYNFVVSCQYSYSLLLSLYVMDVQYGSSKTGSIQAAVMKKNPASNPDNTYMPEEETTTIASLVSVVHRRRITQIRVLRSVRAG